MSPLAIAGAILIGVSLGLTGAGGSILTLPVLVYLVGLPPDQAVGVSLFVVAAAASVGAVQRWRGGDVHLRAAGIFGGVGMVGAVIGARFTNLVDERYLMLGFAILMIAVGLRMFRKNPTTLQPVPECKPIRCMIAGAGTGLLTGFLGVGGGFILMPALMRFAKLPLALATGTSLAVIAANSWVGGISHATSISKNLGLTLAFAAIAIIGTLLGKKLSSRLPLRTIQILFGCMVLITAAAILADAILN